MAHDKKICFAASGGGHLRQLIQIMPSFEAYPHYILTEETALGESMQSDHDVCFVPHFAFGQLKTEGLLKCLGAGIKNAVVSSYLFFKERPDVVITSGAGAVYTSVMWAWLMRRDIIYLESIARVTKPSLFGRMVHKFTKRTIVQWPDLVAALEGSVAVSPLVVEPCADDPNRAGIFVTVGTVLPFDRLVRGVEGLLSNGTIKEPVSVQTGKTNAVFDGLDVFEGCSYDALNDRMERSDIVICHGGSGSILGALKSGARVVSMARSAAMGEHYDDHQKDIVTALAEMNLISVAQDENDLKRAIEEARARPRQYVHIDPSVFVTIIEEHLKEASMEETDNYAQAIKRHGFLPATRARLRQVVLDLRRLYLVKIWGMDIHPKTRISLSVSLDKTHPRGIHIEEGATIAFGTAILTHDTVRGLYKDTVVGRDCRIGARCILLPGVRIGDGSIIGAGSVVTKDIPPHCVAVGNPARVIREGVEVEYMGRITNPGKKTKARETKAA